MLRVLFIVSPGSGQRSAVFRSLQAVEIAEVYAPPEGEGGPASITSEIAGAHGVGLETDARLLDGQDAIDLVEWVASQEPGEERLVVMLAPPEVVRDVVIHALQAPVPADRLRFDPGTFAEIEVRLDAPWTVNRLNDGCHLDAGLP